MSETLCLRADLDATGAKEVVLDVKGVRTSIVVVRYGSDIRAYINSCPHARTPLNFQEDRFFDLSGTYLHCTTHGAAFEVASGRCIRGPAKGHGLMPVAVRLEDDQIVTDLSLLPRL